MPSVYTRCRTSLPPRRSQWTAVGATLAASISLLVFGAAVQAQVLAQSHFDNDAEGWTVRGTNFCSILVPGTNLSTVVWQPTGGNPGGFFRHNEANTGTSYFRAPASFLGNKSAAYGGSFRFDCRLTTTDPDVFTGVVDDVYIQGGGVALIGDVPLPGRGSWSHASVALLPGLWRLNSCTGPFATEAQIRGVLANISDIYIRAEQIFGNETEDIDNVVLSSSPDPDTCLAPSAWAILDNAEPPGMWRHAMAVDTDRNLLVAFGGDTGETDTWEYDLSTLVWSRYHPPVSPSRRGGHAMAYDRARHKLVMTGGGYISTNFSDVWEYDTGTHLWSSATPMPQARAGHAMSYDTTRDVIVLYGGLGSGVAGAVDVLERSAASSDWVSRASNVNPGAQIGYAMAYDALRDRTVLVGEGTTAVSVFEWNGNQPQGTWQLISFSGTVPPARQNPGVAYDANLQRIILVGGENRSDNWAYDGVSWASRRALPTNSRDEHAVAYNPLSQGVMVLGGVLGSSSPQRDLIQYNSAANAWSTLWSRISPSARSLFGAAFDEVGSRMICYGGGLTTRGGIVQQFGGGAFSFDGSAWQPITVTGAPGTRWFNPLVYNSDRRSILMYGGAVGSGSATATSQLWELDLATLAWSDRTIRPAMPPGPRFEHATAFDRVHHRMIVHGGTNDIGARLGDTWLYDPTTNAWQVGPAGPSARTGAAMAFDEARGVCVLFGGQSGANTFENDTWEFDGAAWRLVTPVSGNPASRFRHRLVYDSDRRTVVLIGGINFTTGNADPYMDLWEFDGVRWRLLTQDPAVSPLSRLNASVVYDTARHTLVQFGGESIQNGTYRTAQVASLQLPAAVPGPSIIQQPPSSMACRAGVFSVGASALGEVPGASQWQIALAGDQWMSIGTEPSALACGGSVRASTPNDTTTNIFITPCLGRSEYAVRCVVGSGCASTISRSATLSICASDFNCDGQLDADDLGDFITCFFSVPSCSGADFNGDADINADDLGDFITSYFGGCG